MKNDYEKIAGENNYDFEKINEVQKSLFNEFVENNINESILFFHTNPSEDSLFLESHAIEFFKHDAAPVNNLDTNKIDFFQCGGMYLKMTSTSAFDMQKTHDRFHTKEQAIKFWKEIIKK